MFYNKTLAIYSVKSNHHSIEVGQCLYRKKARYTREKSAIAMYTIDQEIVRLRKPCHPTLVELLFTKILLHDFSGMD